MREIVILGSTGSIGVQALEVIAANPNKFKVIALSAGGSNIPTLIAQAQKFGVGIIGVSSGGEIARSLTSGISVIDGESASSEIAAITCDIVLNGITGSIGLGPTLAALAAGNKVALANKESLVAGGALVAAFGLERITPVDSEHSALYQCFMAGSKSEVKRAILTASGGAFRDRRDLSSVTLAEALTHPTWSMGPVVTINSATLVNKGLEIIEAHYLFDLPYEKIEAVIHPQSVVHSMVEFIDGATIAQLSPPNMKGPIAYALGAPDRTAHATTAVDWSAAQSWNFSPIDSARFPAVDLARHCGSRGGGLPAVFNAANEVAVAAFMSGDLEFSAIVEIVAATTTKLDSIANSVIRDLSDVSAIEEDARVVANALVVEKK
ncbi:MAG: 1-deoxy-D-xylulose-5-phosphate reductoisomerase [Actinomycetes bacterium]